MSLPLKADSDEINAAEYNEIRNLVRTVLFADAKQYGAVGDGVQDDTAAIQAALDAANRVYIPPGTYKVTSSLKLNANNHLFGAGESTLIQADITSAIIRAKNRDTAGTPHTRVYDLALDNTSRLNANGIGVDLGNINESQADRLHITNVETGIRYGYGAVAVNGFYNTARDISIRFCETGHKITNGGNEILIAGGRVDSPTSFGISQEPGSSGVTVLHVPVESFPGATGLRVQGQRLTSVGQLFESGGTAINLTGSTNASILNPIFLAVGDSVAGAPADATILHNGFPSSILNTVEFVLRQGTGARAATLKAANDFVQILNGAGNEGSAIEFIEMAGDPAAPPSNNARLYVIDNGAGKTALRIRFPTGGVQTISTEP